jgi:hypothetical protein
MNVRCEESFRFVVCHRRSHSLLLYYQGSQTERYRPLLASQRFATMTRSVISRPKMFSRKIWVLGWVFVHTLGGVREFAQIWVQVDPILSYYVAFHLYVDYILIRKVYVCRCPQMVRKLNSKLKSTAEYPHPLDQSIDSSQTYMHTNMHTYVHTNPQAQRMHKDIHNTRKPCTSISRRSEIAHVTTVTTKIFRICFPHRFGPMLRF